MNIDMEAQTIILLVGFGTLLIERLARWLMRIRASKCCSGTCDIEMASINNDNES